MADDKNFLSRWSQRKLQKKHEEETEEAAGTQELADEAEALVEAPAPSEDGASEIVEAERHPAEDIDINSLTKDSDFTVFMQKGVPQEVKRRALRKLWTSDPLLANLDGLNDYEDMERVYGMGPIGATAWKIGRGFLTDDELGLNAKEKPEPDSAEETESAEEPSAEAEETEVATAAETSAAPEAEGTKEEDAPGPAEAEVAQAPSEEETGGGRNG